MFERNSLITENNQNLMCEELLKESSIAIVVHINTHFQYMLSLSRIFFSHMYTSNILDIYRRTSYDTLTMTFG